MEYGIVFRVTPSAKLREGFDLRYVVWSHQFFKIQGLHITAEQQEPISSKAVRWQSFWYIIFVDYKLYIYIYVMWTYPSTLHVYLISINDIQSVESYFIIYPGSKNLMLSQVLEFLHWQTPAINICGGSPKWAIPLEKNTFPETSHASRNHPS